MTLLSKKLTCLFFVSLFMLGACNVGGIRQIVAEGGDDGDEEEAPELSSITTSVDGLNPTFEGDVTSYTLNTNFLTIEIVVSAETSDPTAILMINGETVDSGEQVTVPLEEGSNDILVDVTSADQSVSQTYTLTVVRDLPNQFIQQAYLKASNAEAGDSFADADDDVGGGAVSIDEDTIVVGAICEDSNATGVNGDEIDNTFNCSGAAYVFVRSNGVWTQQAYLKASNTGNTDEFGHSVAVSGDLIAVGAVVEESDATGINGDETDNDASGSGAVYIFTRSGTTWTQEAYIKASNTGTSDLFGTEVAISGNTLVVTAKQEDSNATGVDGDETDNSAANSGAAYVFTRSGTTWTQQAYLKASDTAAGDRFGYGVDIDDDTIIVGAYQQDGSDDGAAYVFTRSGTTWTQQQKLTASNAEGRGDEFGTSVAVDEDTIAVGAPREESNATGINGNQASNNTGGAGAVYVFTRSGTTWTQEAYIKASNTPPNLTGDFFGVSLDLSGNLLLVGGSTEDSNSSGINGDETDNSSSNSGAVYVFARDGTTWEQQGYVKADSPGSNDQFGDSVAVSGDTMLVAAPFEDSAATGINGDASDNSANDAGAAYVFQ